MSLKSSRKPSKAKRQLKNKKSDGSRSRFALLEVGNRFCFAKTPRQRRFGKPWTSSGFLSSPWRDEPTVRTLLLVQQNLLIRKRQIGNRTAFASRTSRGRRLSIRKTSFSNVLPPTRFEPTVLALFQTVLEQKFAPRANSCSNGAGSRTRTYEGRSREIYSLLSLPLDDSSTLLMEPRTGFEPVTSSLPWMRSTNWAIAAPTTIISHFFIILPDFRHLLLSAQYLYRP